MTKPVPGARRGRPPKAKVPKLAAKRGRKLVAFIDADDDRHAIALTDALLRIGVAPSENAACDAAAVLRIGKEIEPDLHRAGGLTQTRWQKRNARGVAATFKGYATTLRGKRRKYRDARSAWWRRQMRLALTLALLPGDDAAADKAHALALASSVGEAVFAERVLFAMIDARDNSPASATSNAPELSA